MITQKNTEFNDSLIDAINILPFASFGQRIAAITIDLLFLIMINFLLKVIQYFLLFQISIKTMLVIIIFSYFIIFCTAVWNMSIRSGKTGQSIGKQFMNIAVLTKKGRIIGLEKSLIREIIGKGIINSFCFIGYLNALWNDKNQGWHDKIACSYVYKVEEEFSKKIIT